MWLHRRKDKDGDGSTSTNVVSSENISPPATLDQHHKKSSTSTNSQRKDEKKPSGIRKKILQLGGFGHHQQPATDGSSVKLSSSELKRLEQTKQLLFKQTSPTNYSDLPPIDYPTITRDDTSLNGDSVSETREPLRNLSPPNSEMTQVVTPRSVKIVHTMNGSNGNRDSIDSPSQSIGEFLFGTPKDFNVSGLKLPALASVQVDVREVTLRRNVEGDFGFTIRRATFGNSTVVFAEPVEKIAGPPRPSDLLNGLLPGDQLLEIDGRPVSGMQRDELLYSIQNAQQTIRLRVRVVPELAEICGRATALSAAEGHIQFNSVAGSSSSFEGVPENERYWLIHSNGYTAARFIENLPDGRAKIEVAGQQITVDTQDIDRANPTNSDRANDLSALKYLNETSAIHLLRQRQGCSLHFTKAGSNNLIYIANTFGQQNDNSTVNENLIQMFKGSRRNQDGVPHIFSTAQQVYRNLQTTAKSQAVVFTGATSSGKSLQTRQFVQFICTTSGWSKLLSFKQIEFAIGVLEAFGNCATVFNRNSSRFIQFLTLGFNNTAALCSAKAQTFLLDVERLTKCHDSDSTFHVFYYLWEGADEDLQKKLHFHSIDKPFIGQLSGQEDRNAAKVGWSHLMDALRKLQLNENQIQGISNVLGAIFHLMHSGATNNPASRSSFIRTQNAQFAAELLGVQFDQLNLAVFRGNQQQPEMSSRFTMTNKTGPESLKSFVQCLYNELFSSLTNLINQALNPQKHSPSLTIQLFDVPGSKFFSQSTRACDLNDLLYNYLNERLSELFYKQSFIAPAEFYAREQVNVTVEKPLMTPERCTRLLDLKQQLLNSADVDRRAEEQRGLLYILEEESVFPGAQDASFLERIFIHCEGSRLIKRSPRGKLQFVLGHSHNSAPTTYSVEGWLKQAQPSHAVAIVPKLLQNSNLESILELFTVNPIGRVETSMKLRRATQSVNDLSGARSFGGFFSSISVQLDHIFNTIERASRIQFVHCIQSHRPETNVNAQLDVLDVSYVRQQMRSYLLIDSIRTSNHGYPERLPFKDFRRRFQCLVPLNQHNLNDALDDRSATQRILQTSEIFEHRYRLGLSQILLRSDVLVELEERRDICLSGLIVSLQFQCRHALAARWLEKRRIHEQAVKCLQRNINVHVKLRLWPWWKLYLNVLPLLNQARSDEVEREWREKLKRSEVQNNELRLEKNRLDAQFGEMEQIYKAECQTTQHLTENLEREVETRMQMEAELRALKQKLQQRKEQAVAGRHLRDKHPDIYAQVLNEEADRRNRKRAAEFGGPTSNGPIVQPLSGALSDGSYSPPSSNPLGTPQPVDHPIPQHQQFESQFKRFKFDEELFTRMGINLQHFSTEGPPQFTLPSMDPLNFMSANLTNAAMDFQCKQENGEITSNTDTLVSNGHATPEQKQVDQTLLDELDRLRNSDTANRAKIQKLLENLRDDNEQNINLRSRNDILEKRSQNQNSEVQVFKDSIEELRSIKEKLERDLSDTTSNLQRKTGEVQELRDQNAEIRTNLSRARREIDELTDDASRGGSTSEAELASLRKAKRDLEQKIVELEDQLDDTQNQNDILEQNVTRLNLNLERLRSDAQRTSDAKDDELEESRSNFQRRLRAFEEQIAELNEANANLQRQIRVHEQRGRQFETQSQYSFESSTNNYKREYKKTLAMLKDTQNLLTIERQKADKTTLIRRLRTQLEEAEEARISVLRSKTSLESDLAELNVEIENVRMAKAMLENRVKMLVHEKSDAVLATKDMEEQLNNALRDYRNNLSKTEQNSAVINTQALQIAELETEKQKLSVQLADIESQTSNYRSNYVEAHKLQLLESRFAELKGRVEYERLERQKFEANAQRLEDEVDRLEGQLNELQKTVSKQQDQIQKHKREVLAEQDKINEVRKQKEELEFKLRKSRDNAEDMGDEHERLKSDLILAQRRIEGLQAALNAGSCADDEEDRLNELSDLDEEDQDSMTTTTDNLTSHNDSAEHQSNPAFALSETS